VPWRPGLPMSDSESDASDETDINGPRCVFDGGARMMLVKRRTTSAMLNEELRGADADAKLAGLELVDVRYCALNDFSFLDKCVALTHLNINGNGGVALLSRVLVRGAFRLTWFALLRANGAAGRGVSSHDSQGAQCVVSAHRGDTGRDWPTDAAELPRLLRLSHCVGAAVAATTDAAREPVDRGGD
jgi:hypothetical protein